MGVAEIIALLTEGASAVKTAIDAYEQIKSTLSETDLNAIEAALAKAEAETDRLRPLVDEALDEATKH